MATAAGPPGGAAAAPDRAAGLLEHLVATGRAAVGGHLAGVATAAVVAWSEAPRSTLLVWLAAVVVVSMVRAALLLRPGATLVQLRIAAVANAAAWGVGPLLVFGPLSVPTVLLMMVVFSGLMAAGTITLSGDAVAFYLYELVLLGPLAGAILAHGSSRTHLIAAAVVAIFASQVHRSARRELIRRLDATRQAGLSEDGAAHDRAFLSSLLASSPTAIATIDRGGLVLGINPAFTRLFQLSENEIVGREIDELIVPPSAREEAIRLADRVMAGGIVVAEVPRRRRDGSIVLVRVSAAAALGAAEGSLFILYDDVTEIRETEQRVRAALEEARGTAERADRAKTAFLANMSHEIRTPLNGVLGMVELLLGGNLGAEERRTATVIRESGESLLAIINDVLDLSKIEAGRLELEEATFEPARAVDSVVRLFHGQASAKGLSLTATIEPEVPSLVVGDAGRIRQIIANLVGNAVKFTDRGTVFLTVARECSSGPMPLVSFVVRDTGIGIAPDKLDHIFEEFAQADASTTRRYGGTGLGLAISRRLATMMGGALTVVSEVGRGSEFRLIVPLRLAAEASNPGVTAPVPGSPSGVDPLRILIAEDNPVNQRVAATLLQRRGHQVDVVENGVLAVAAVRAHRYDVVLMDVQMPELDGLDATRQIRADPALAGLPIVACTAHALQQERAECLEAGVNGYLTKPFRPQDLFEVVERLANGTPPGSA